MSDLEIIKQIEKELNIELRKVSSTDFQKFEEISTNQFVTDVNENVIFLKINGIKINDLSSIVKLKNIMQLNLFNSFLSDVSELKSLKKLKKLNLIKNNIKDISFVSELKLIEILLLNENEVEDISPIRLLNNLIVILLAHNKITNIKVLEGLDKLMVLFLGSNPIKDISPLKSFFLKEGVDCVIYDNPLKYPPIEIAELGIDAINEYFQHCERGTSTLQEAKITVIGEAGSGKTTFAKKVQNPNSDMPKPEDTTYGIDVFNWNFDSEHNKNLNTQIWDFGGQDIYHGTHQFFFSDKSLICFAC